jgi:hypothetical protein
MILTQIPTSTLINPSFLVWKSGMAAAVSRKAADEMFKVKKNLDQLNKLMNHLLSKSYIYSTCNDELFWATVFGNSKCKSDQFQSFTIIYFSIQHIRKFFRVRSHQKQRGQMGDAGKYK